MRSIATFAPTPVRTNDREMQVSEPQKTECVLILRRILDAPIERVWRAWTEAAELAQWYVAGDDHLIHSAEADVRVGGVYRVAFGPPGKPPYFETGRYTEIVPMKRLAWRAEVVVDDDSRAAQLAKAESVVLELVDLGDGRTQIILTDTGDEVWRAGEGWMPCLASLARHLANAHVAASA